MLDRIDLIVPVPRLSLRELRSSAGESSQVFAGRIAQARAFQHERCGRLNSALAMAGIAFHCRLDPAGRSLLDRAVERLGFTARAMRSALEVARTIADLQGSDSIQAAHLAEAIQFKAQAAIRCS